MSKNLKVQELTPEQLKAVEARMRRPRGRWAFFLGKNERLLDICRYDSESLKRIGKTPEHVSSRLSELTSLYKREWKCTGIRVLREAGLEIEGTYDQRYSELCPFGPEYKVKEWSFERGAILDLNNPYDPYHACAGQQDLGRWDFTIKRINDGKLFSFGDLAIHLIEAHHFFEGQATEYRLEPLRAAYVLGLIDERTYMDNKPRERMYDPGMQAD